MHFFPCIFYRSERLALGETGYAFKWEKVNVQSIKKNESDNWKNRKNQIKPISG